MPASAYSTLGTAKIRTNGYFVTLGPTSKGLQILVQAAHGAISIFPCYVSQLTKWEASKDSQIAGTLVSAVLAVLSMRKSINKEKKTP